MLSASYYVLHGKKWQFLTINKKKLLEKKAVLTQATYYAISRVV
jgi:hypothetical protein